MNFGKWLKGWRTNQKLSTRQLAALLKVSQTYIWKIENNKVGPSLRFLRKFSGVLSCPEVYTAAGRLIPQKELEKIKKTPNAVDKATEFFLSKQTTGHSFVFSSDDPELAKFILDIYSKLKNTPYKKHDLRFIKKMIYGYFPQKEE